jgi:hypothetical protein
MLIALTPANLNLTLLVIYFIPAFLRMIVSYQFYLKNSKMPFVRKLWNLYAGFFIVDSFIFITSIKAVINFILRKPQGWKITPKNVEGVPSWKSVIMNRRGTLLFSCSILAIILIKWIFAFNCNLAALISYFPAMLMYFNVLICVLLYGKEGRKGSEVAIGA